MISYDDLGDIFRWKKTTKSVADLQSVATGSWDTPEEIRHIIYKELFVSFGYDFKFDPIAQISTAKILIAQNYTAFVSIAQTSSTANSVDIFKIILC